MELQTLLNDLAHRVAEKGTESEFRSLETLAAFAADRAPGAVAALIDWTGAEVMRARAFGRVVGIAMNELSPWEQSALGDELTGTPSLALVA